MNVLNRIVSVVVALLLMVLGLGGCSASENEASRKRTIVDASGNTIELPDTVDRYAVAWTGLTDILLMFDGTEHIVAYPEKSDSFKWIHVVYPQYAEKVCLSNDGISAENILETEAQIVFLKAADDQDLYNRLRECGVAAIDCNFDTYEELKNVVNLIAGVLGTDTVLEKASAYCSYIDNAVNDTTAFSSSIADSDRVSALVMKDAKDFSAYGASRYTGKWVEMCGGRYSMVNEDTYANVNLNGEQIFQYNPDFIFLAMPNQVDKFVDDARWSKLTAVQNGNVYNIPGGFNTWSNRGAESALVFRWAASIMYPDVTSFDINAEIKYFYSSFYDYEPSDDEIDKILTSSF